MSSAVIFEQVSKSFRKRASRYRSLREELTSLFRWSQRTPAERLWALQDVDLELPEGTAIGLVGANGAGKSTLLKLIARISRPSTGRVRIRGRVGALIEIGAGIHPELTGRENIYTYGSIMGLSRHEINRRFDVIVDFAELAPYLDMPVKRYSSGMQARLGFSIAAHVDPDILLVDEVLAVGDLRFQRKCQNHLQTLRHKGTTIIFVSHNMGAVEALCDRAVYLEAGRVVAVDETASIVQAYLNDLNAKDQSVEFGKGERWGSGEAKILSVETYDQDGCEKSVFLPGEPMRVRMHYQCHEPIANPFFGCIVCNSSGTRLFAGWTYHQPIETLTGEGWADCLFEALPCHPGNYGIMAAIQDRELKISYDRWAWAVGFRVEATAGYISQSQMSEMSDGLVVAPYEWRLAS